MRYNVTRRVDVVERGENGEGAEGHERRLGPDAEAPGDSGTASPTLCRGRTRLRSEPGACPVQWLARVTLRPSVRRDLTLLEKDDVMTFDEFPRMPEPDVDLAVVVGAASIQSVLFSQWPKQLTVRAAGREFVGAISPRPAFGQLPAAHTRRHHIGDHEVDRCRVLFADEQSVAA